LARPVCFVGLAVSATDGVWRVRPPNAQPELRLVLDNYRRFAGANPHTNGTEVGGGARLIVVRGLGEGPKGVSSELGHMKEGACRTYPARFAIKTRKAAKSGDRKPVGRQATLDRVRLPLSRPRASAMQAKMPAGSRKSSCSAGVSLQKSIGEKGLQNWRQIFGDVLGDEARPKMPRGGTMKPDGGGRRFE
jgi:hypothetical protein